MSFKLPPPIKSFRFLSSLELLTQRLEIFAFDIYGDKCVKYGMQMIIKFMNNIKLEKMKYNLSNCKT